MCVCMWKEILKNESRANLGSTVSVSTGRSKSSVVVIKRNDARSVSELSFSS